MHTYYNDHVVNAVFRKYSLFVVRITRLTNYWILKQVVYSSFHSALNV
jgi:hypothetical protein